MGEINTGNVPWTVPGQGSMHCFCLIYTALKTFSVSRIVYPKPEEKI